jgi:hypothetical protein
MKDSDSHNTQTATVLLTLVNPANISRDEFAVLLRDALVKGDLNALSDLVDMVNTTEVDDTTGFDR